MSIDKLLTHINKTDKHFTINNRTYLKNKIRVQGKARNGEKAEHTRSM
jgi:hypothetical protein